MNNLSPAALAKMIDHSLLHPTLTDAEMAAGCELAKAYGVAAACVKPYFVELAAGILRDATVSVCTVVAFPHGNSPVRIKLAEIEEVMACGATEIDLVVNIGKVLGEDWDYLATEIAAARELTAGKRGILKIIFENDYLQDRHIIKLCEICSAHRVDFVKTSTGYGFVKQANGMYAYHGATDRHLRLMRAHCPPTVGIKAAGGIRTLEDLLRVRGLGVTRVGATATTEILTEARRRAMA